MVVGSKLLNRFTNYVFKLFDKNRCINHFVNLLRKLEKID